MLKANLSLLSKYRTELMGFSAIGILMCHATGNEVAMPSVLYQICSLGQIGVALFFLLSGMGMYYSLTNNQWGGVIDWYRVRYIKLLVPYLLMALPFYLWTDVLRNNSWMDFWINVTTLAYWTRGGGVWFVGAIIPLYFIVPWWHKLLNGKRYSWIPTLIVFIPLLCLGSYRRLGEVAFFFVGYEVGHHIKEGKNVNMIYWVLVPIMFYIVCHLIPSLDWIPRSLLLAIPFMLLASVFFDKIWGWVNKPIRFMGKISLESYMANVMLPAVFAVVPWIVNGVNYNVGNRLLYLCVVLFGILLAYLVNSVAQPLVKRLIVATEK